MAPHAGKNFLIYVHFIKGVCRNVPGLVKEEMLA
jgi:hypothetical protein